MQVSFVRLFSKTTKPIFTKILHDIVALVASSSKMKPCFHLVNVQRMHVVSVCLHYGNIIWLPWQHHLTNRKNEVQIYHLHPKRSDMVKRLPKSVQYIRRYSTKYAIFLATSYLTFTKNEPCQLWSYWTEFQEIFTRYTGIICTINAHS